MEAVVGLASHGKMLVRGPDSHPCGARNPSDFRLLWERRMAQRAEVCVGPSPERGCSQASAACWCAGERKPRVPQRAHREAAFPGDGWALRGAAGCWSSARGL